MAQIQLWSEQILLNSFEYLTPEFFLSQKLPSKEIWNVRNHSDGKYLILSIVYSISFWLEVVDEGGEQGEPITPWQKFLSELVCKWLIAVSGQISGDCCPAFWKTRIPYGPCDANGFVLSNLDWTYGSVWTHLNETAYGPTLCFRLNLFPLDLLLWRGCRQNEYERITLR